MLSRAEPDVVEFQSASSSTSDTLEDTKSLWQISPWRLKEEDPAVRQ
jgi:hypothetical protein